MWLCFLLVLFKPLRKIEDGTYSWFLIHSQYCLTPQNGCIGKSSGLQMYVSNRLHKSADAHLFLKWYQRDLCLKAFPQQRHRPYPISFSRVIRSFHASKRFLLFFQSQFSAFRSDSCYWESLASTVLANRLLWIARLDASSWQWGWG